MVVAAIRRRVWEIVEVARPGDRPSWIFDVAIRALIALNVIGVVLETIPSVMATAGTWLRAFDTFSVMVFTVEYVLRLWGAREDPRYRGVVLGRLRFAVTPLAVIDLLAVLPFWLPVLGVDLRAIRGVRLFRLFRILKIARYSRALQTFGRVFRRKAEELVLTFALVGFLLLIASLLLYYAEHDAQPDVFSSVPAAMWWGIVTLTTVGYGDVYPITVAGRVLGGVFALSAVLLIALPTAILGAGFVEELDARKAGRKLEEATPGDSFDGGPEAEAGPRCPHCGKRLTE